jgi:hypothetical protein
VGRTVRVSVVIVGSPRRGFRRVGLLLLMGLIVRARERGGILRVMLCRRVGLSWCYLVSTPCIATRFSESDS